MTAQASGIFRQTWHCAPPAAGPLYVVLSFPIRMEIPEHCPCLSPIARELYGSERLHNDYLLFTKIIIINDAKAQRRIVSQVLSRKSGTGKLNAIILILSYPVKHIINEFAYFSRFPDTISIPQKNAVFIRPIHI